MLLRETTSQSTSEEILILSMLISEQKALIGINEKEYVRTMHVLCGVETVML